MSDPAARANPLAGNPLLEEVHLDDPVSLLSLLALDEEGSP